MIRKIAAALARLAIPGLILATGVARAQDVKLDVGFAGDSFDRFFAAIENRGSVPVEISSFHLLAQASDHDCHVMKSVPRPVRLFPGRTAIKTFPIPPDCLGQHIFFFGSSIYDPLGAVIASTAYVADLTTGVAYTKWTGADGVPVTTVTVTVTNNTDHAITVKDLHQKRTRGGETRNDEYLEVDRTIQPHMADTITFVPSGGQEGGGAIGDKIEIELRDSEGNVIGGGTGEETCKKVDCP